MSKKNVTDVRPFRIEVPQAELDDLRDRLARVREPHPIAELKSDWSRGIAPDYIQELTKRWSTSFDWRAQEAELNELDHFTTEIDGQNIHFLHVRSPESDATPLLVVHGFPSSFVEYLDVIGPLSDPRAHGADPADAFHLVIPSLPGFGFSAPLSSPGWDLGRTAKAFGELMTRLGYERFAAQGEDLGYGIIAQLGTLFPDRVVGTHSSSDKIQVGLFAEQFPPLENLSKEEAESIEASKLVWAGQKGYQVLQCSQPNALAAGLTDSPTLQLAWMAEKFATWTGATYKVDPDWLLTMISIYWFTRTGASAANYYWEMAHSGAGGRGTSDSTDFPQGWAIFNTDPLLRKFLDPDNKIAHYKEYSEGGHFPALEVPDLLVDDIRAFFRELRN